MEKRVCFVPSILSPLNIELMKYILLLSLITSCGFSTLQLSAQSTNADAQDHAKNLYIDVHQLEPGKVTYKAVAEAHAKDLAVQDKYGVHFLKYWVDEEK